MWDCSGFLRIRSHMSYYIILSLVEAKPFLFITMLEIEIVSLFIYMHYHLLLLLIYYQQVYLVYYLYLVTCSFLYTYKSQVICLSYSQLLVNYALYSLIYIVCFVYVAYPTVFNGCVIIIKASLLCLHCLLSLFIDRLSSIVACEQAKYMQHDWLQAGLIA